jgi:hypothetical protein
MMENMRFRGNTGKLMQSDEPETVPVCLPDSFEKLWVIQ